jgi:hypothetical protein
MAYVPMIWNSDWNENDLRAFKTKHPECEYLLAYNEPNLELQAELSPAQAAADWPRLKAIAQELNLKIVSPAMNYSGWDEYPQYHDPINWLDDFFEQDGVSLDDISAISIHSYMSWPSALKSYVGRFKKYGKPIWMTEFCAWDDYNTAAGGAGAVYQVEHMSQAVIYMELDPDVERYAWFIPRMSDVPNPTPTNSHPWQQLLTKTTPPALTNAGKVYANMSACDPAIWAPTGQRIEAEHFTRSDIVDLITQPEQWRDSVVFRPTTDPEGGTLDVYKFTGNRWMEYQINAATAKEYTLSLRNVATQAASIDVSVDGTKKATVPLTQTSASAWRTSEVKVQIPAGHHTIRLAATAGNVALNWLKLD